MSDTLRNRWLGLSLRERWLVGVAAVLATAAIGWLAIYSPLRAALVTARESHGLAVDRQAAISARVTEIRRLQADGNRTATNAGPTNDAAVTLVLAQGAAEQGFILSRNDAVGDSGATIAIANVRAPALIAWLAKLEDADLTVTDLSLRPNADGTVAMTASIRAMQ